MFFMVSETKTAQELVEGTIGKVGRMAELDKSSLASVSLWTRELGKIWYGDIEGQKQIDALKVVSKELKETIYVLPEWEVGMYADGRPFSDAAITEITA